MNDFDTKVSVMRAIGHIRGGGSLPSVMWLLAQGLGKTAGLDLNPGPFCTD